MCSPKSVVGDGGCVRICFVEDYAIDSVIHRDSIYSVGAQKRNSISKVPPGVRNPETNFEVGPELSIETTNTLRTPLKAPSATALLVVLILRARSNYYRSVVRPASNRDGHDDHDDHGSCEVDGLFLFQSSALN